MPSVKRLRLLAVALVTLALVVRLLPGPRTTDDAYISFDYARHVAAGHGFVFNAGEHVLGTTTPLYTLLLSVLLLLTHGSLPWLSLLVAATADGISTLLVFTLTEQACQSVLAAAFAAATFALAIPSVFFAQSGMETSLFTCLLLLTFWFYGQEKQWGWGLCAGLAILTRPEGLLLLVVLIIDYAWVNGSGAVQRLKASEGSTSLTAHLCMLVPCRALLCALIMTIPWIVWATWYFGLPVPQSLIAKGGNVYHLMPGSNLSVILLLVGRLPFGPLWRGVGLMAIIVTSLVAWWKLGRTMPHLRPALIFVTGLLSLYALVSIRNILYFDWYGVPVIPFLLIFFYTGLRYTFSNPSHTPARALISVVGLLAVAAQLQQFHAYPEAGNRRFSPVYQVGAAGWVGWREDRYMQICFMLKSKLSPTTVIAASEIGTLGYFCPGRILDTVGLVTPGLAHYYPLPSSAMPRSITAIPAKLIDDWAPSYVIAGPSHIEATLLRDPRFISRYKLIIDLHPPGVPDDATLVYQRE